MKREYDTKIRVRGLRIQAVHKSEQSDLCTVFLWNE